MDDLLAAALAQVTVQDETGAAVPFKGLWAERTVVLAFVRHLGCIFCRQQVAGLTKRLPEIERRGATLVVAPRARAHRPFRQATGYAGALYVDRSGRVPTAGLVRGWGSTYHVRAVLKGRGGAREGLPSGRAPGRRGGGSRNASCSGRATACTTSGAIASRGQRESRRGGGGDPSTAAVK
jgi:peroxiredoxin